MSRARMVYTFIFQSYRGATAGFVEGRRLRFRAVVFRGDPNVVGFDWFWGAVQNFEGDRS